MEAIRELLERATFRAKVAVGAFSITAAAVMVASTFADSERYDREPFAVPAPASPSVSWDEQRAAFADRMTRAFDLPPAVAGEFAEWILEASQRQQLAPELLASLVLAESAFRKNARSSVGAIGPAQIRDEYWGAFCGGDLHQPADNIYCGAQILASFRDACGALRCALHSYNLGPNGARHAYWEPAKARYVAKIENGLARFDAITM